MTFVWYWPQITYLVIAVLSLLWAGVENRVSSVVAMLIGMALLFFGGFFTGGVLP